MTWYVPRPQSMMTYSELYSSVSLVNIGLSLDVNINRIFWKNTSGHRLTAWISLQLKNTVMWMTDNNFDGIRTIFGETRHNAAWIPQIGIIWNIYSSCKTKGKQ